MVTGARLVLAGPTVCKLCQTFVGLWRFAIEHEEALVDSRVYSEGDSVAVQISFLFDGVALQSKQCLAEHVS